MKTCCENIIKNKIELKRLYWLNNLFFKTLIILVSNNLKIKVSKCISKYFHTYCICELFWSTT